MIRIATVGTSVITRSMISALGEVSGIQAAVAYSRDAERADDFAASTGIPSSCSDFEQLLASEDVDALYIASPNALHFQHALAALQAGKHVLLEKPATPTAAEFERLMRAATERGVVLLEAMRNAYDPGYGVLRELLPQLGVLRRASFAYCQRSSRYDLVLAGQQVNIFDPALAGGALLDLGVYCLSAMVSLFGEPESVVGADVTLPSGADGAGAVLARYPGFVVDLSYSKITESSRVNEVQGELGTLTFDSVPQPGRITLRRHDGAILEHTMPVRDGNLVWEVSRFVELVGGSASADVGADQQRTLNTLRLVDALRAPAG